MSAKGQDRCGACMVLISKLSASASARARWCDRTRIGGGLDRPASCPEAHYQRFMRGESSDRQALLVCESLYPSARRLCQFRCRLAPASCRTGDYPTPGNGACVDGSHPFGWGFSGSKLPLPRRLVPARRRRPGVPIGKGARPREAVVIAASAPTAPSVFRAESGGRRVPAFVWEIAIAVAAYLVYEAARFIAVGSYPDRARCTPIRSSRSSVDLDLNVESTVQRRVPALAAAAGAQLRLPGSAEPGPARVARPAVPAEPHDLPHAAQHAAGDVAALAARSTRCTPPPRRAWPASASSTRSRPAAR